jgi:hypothetical protein
VAIRIYTTTLLLENTFYREHILHTSGVAFRIYNTTLVLENSTREPRVCAPASEQVCGKNGMSATPPVPTPRRMG